MIMNMWFPSSTLTPIGTPWPFHIYLNMCMVPFKSERGCKLYVSLGIFFQKRYPAHVSPDMDDMGKRINRTTIGCTFPVDLFILCISVG